MDTVVKSMLEDEEEPPKGLVLFGRDLSQIPCFRESFLYGIASGVGIGLATFVRTSKPMKSQHVGVAGFALTTLVYWSYCRFQWSQKRFDAALMQESLKHKMITEGVEKKLEAKGVLKSA